MPRILTGIQSTATPHLGNVFGAILPALELARKEGNESFLFIADLHSLTQIKNAEQAKANLLHTAAAWLALGLDVNRTIFYRQSRIPEITELMWYLLCFMPYQRMQLAHSFKDKADRLQDVNGGLFTYPVLMAADILLFQADFVPVGKDQLQHLEITRDLAQKVNHSVGKEIFKLPEALTNQQTAYIFGTDGEKMSKSRGNIINIFADEKALKKQINSIITDSTPVEEPKDPEKCNVFKILKLFLSKKEQINLADKYKAGGWGYGNSKKMLLEVILSRFDVERKKFSQLLSDPSEVEFLLEKGEEKAKTIASFTISEIRTALGVK